MLTPVATIGVVKRMPVQTIRVTMLCSLPITKDFCRGEIKTTGNSISYGFGHREIEHQCTHCKRVLKLDEEFPRIEYKDIV